jgi:hypothetical protein
MNDSGLLRRCVSSDDAMNIRAVGVPSGSPSPAAERMRQYRERQRKGLRCVQIQLDATEIDVLVRKGYLEAKDRDNGKAVQTAAATFVGDSFFDTE